jgi:hypothetical protein
MRAFATALAARRGTINVTMGSGEFGRGFYTQDSVGNAMRWASGRSPNDAAVLQIDIADADYLALDRVALTLKQALRLSARLRRNGEEGSYQRGCDVIVGPLNGNTRIEQEKFESRVSQDLLNGDTTTRTVLP